LTEILLAADFTKANVVERDNWFCALALKPVRKEDEGAPLVLFLHLSDQLIRIEKV
jgi:hypothetical protein